MSNKMTVKHEDISGSEFEDMNMAGATFTNINLSGAKFHDINFSDVTFTAAQIGGALFKHIGPSPHGEPVRQRPATFEEALLNDSIFRKVDLTNVQLIECEMTGMTIDGVLVTDLLNEWKKSHN